MTEEAGELYALDPDEFVAARNELAKRLRADKRRDDAAAVAKLRRPSAVAWALNQVARSSPDLVEAALEAGRRLRAATDAAVGGDAGDIRAATAADREATAAVVDAAAERLGARGAAARTDLAATVRAAVLDDAVRDELRRGVLTTEHEASGFGLDLDAALTDAPPARPPRSADQERAEQQRAEQERAQRAAEAQLRKLERRAARLADTADRAEAAARDARAEADAAAAEAAAARDTLEPD